nr:retrotransposon protein, putative, Ty1-copia subclass [Tanacetum cinerariifolium]
MYAVNNKRAKLKLDSSFLWHCRLGYISKKRIEKLQHDGLLNSTDLRAFEKCVSCMSGKMARKPYIHQVERAKDLLGLIHTGVYGPFRAVLRLGASYFITFTNDFSQDLEIIQEEDMHPFINTSLHHEEDDLEIDEPQSDIIPIRMSIRTRHVPDRMCLYINVEEQELGDLGESANYKATLLDPEYDKWLDAMIPKEIIEDLEIIQEEDMHPFINTSLHHEEDDLEIDEPQSDIIPIRMSIRTRHVPDRMCLYINVEEQELGDLGESANYKATLLDPEYEKWLYAIKWLFKKKTDIDGAVHTFKARLVAKSFTQTYGVDYEETFYPVADIRAIRILIAIVMYYDYEI